MKYIQLSGTCSGRTFRWTYFVETVLSVIVTIRLASYKVGAMNFLLIMFLDVPTLRKKTNFENLITIGSLLYATIFMERVFPYQHYCTLHCIHHEWNHSYLSRLIQMKLYRLHFRTDFQNFPLYYYSN